jgi:hypothetical protein
VIIMTASASELEEEIAHLRDLDLRGLRARWHSVFRRKAPDHLVALRGHARRLAKNANVTPEEAAKEFTANIIPGITLIPSGVWGVNRAQEAGCTYLAGG